MRCLKFRIFDLSKVVLFLGCVIAAAGATTIGTNPPAESLTRSRIEQMTQMSQGQRSAWLSYLEHSEKQRALDKKTFQEEMKKAGVQAPIDPPHSYSARSMPLDKDAAWYGSAQARHIADVIVSFQTPAGGWGKNTDMSKDARGPGVQYTTNNLSKFLTKDDFDTPKEPEWNYVGTIDNDATTTQMFFLAKVIGAAGTPGEARATYVRSYLKGMEYLFAAQYPNGGWPQVWPLEGGYHDAITYNDDAVTGVMEVMRNSAAGTGDYVFVPQQVRKRAAESFERGIQSILATQIIVDGKLTVWSQQVDPLTLKPVSGRNYEMPVPCATESDDLMVLLMGLPHPNAQVQKAIRAAAEWFKQTAIYGQSYERTSKGRKLVAKEGAGPIWARYYQTGTNKPVFGDRDKTQHDDVNDLSYERQNGYQWYGSDPKVALDRFEAWRREHSEGK